MPFTRQFTKPDRKDRIKRYIFVDYENVREVGLTGLMKLEKSDHITIFYSSHADTMTFDLHKALNDTPATVELVRVQTGTKNALDFQLSSQLGYYINYDIVANNKNVKYYIVSSDHGYRCLSPFWEEFGAKVVVVGCLNEVCDPLNKPILEETSKADRPDESEKDSSKVTAVKVGEMLGKPSLEEALKALKLNEREEAEVLKFLKDGLTGSPLHDAVQKTIKPAARASEVYRGLKSIINDKAYTQVIADLKMK